MVCYFNSTTNFLCELRLFGCGVLSVFAEVLNECVGGGVVGEFLVGVEFG